MHLNMFVCDFNPNGNGTRLNRDTIDGWYSTLVGQPLVGKLVAKANGVNDFTGHNAKLVKKTDENGTEYDDVVFDTSALGVFVSADIETVDGMEGIVASANVWRRFETACDVIERRTNDGTLQTSWEIQVDEAHMEISDGKAVKVIDSGCFLGHCLLGADVQPAYKSSRILQVASLDTDMDVELADALIAVSECDDNTTKEVSNVDEQMIEPVVEEQQVDVSGRVEAGQPVPEPVVEESSDEVSEQEVAELTDRDIYHLIQKAICKKSRDTCWLEICYFYPEDRFVLAHNWEMKDMVFIKFNYTVNNGEVEIDDGEAIELTITPLEATARVNERDETIAALNEQIVSLNATIAELEPYRAEHDALVAAREKAENDAKVEALKQRAIDAGVFTDAEIEEMSELFDALDESAVNAKIAEKVIGECKKKKYASKEISESRVSVSLESPNSNPADIIRNLINR